jgi:hypothetical protein
VILERTIAEVPEAGIQDDPDVAAAMRESAYANLRVAFAELARDRSPLPAGPPAGAVEEALTTAQAGVPLAALLQTYRIGHAVVWDAVIEAVNEMDELDRQARTDLLLVCSRYTFAYIDRVIPFVTEEYTRERDRLMRGREQRRMQLVRDVLDGAVVDGGELGYELAANHRGAIGWGAGIETVLLRLARALELRLLVVSVSGQTVWAWLGGSGQTDRGLRRALAELELSDSGLAFGRIGNGPEGFRSSHSEARGAHRIAIATGSAVMHYEDVALECLMLADERAARAFVTAELAPLDRGRDGSKLRETLTAYFASGFNASAAAAMLKVNDRTIAYRLNSIEEQLGQPVRARQTELQAAIRLERVLEGRAPELRTFA